MPPPITGGRPLDVGDTSRLLVYAGIFVVIVILATLYMLFKPDSAPVKIATSTASARTVKDEPPAAAPATRTPEAPKSINTTAPTTPKVETVTPAKPASESPKAAPAPAPALTDNAANKSAYFGYARFMAWAYSKGLELPGKALADKFKNEVSLKGVNDPDVTALYNESMEMFRACGDQTLRNSGEQVRIDGPAGRASLEMSDTAKKVREANINMRVLNRKLEARYGKPEIPDFEAPPPVNAQAANPMGGSNPPPGTNGEQTMRAPVHDTETKPVAAAPKPKDEDDFGEKKRDSKLPFEAKQQPKKTKPASEIDE